MKANQIITAVLAIAASWYAMMAVHEVGHCLGAVMTGADNERVEIPLIGFSWTDVSGGSSPLVVAWAGPVFGAVAPLVLLAAFPFLHRRSRQVLLYFIGFCLVANGAYIGIGAFERAGDCRDLLQQGAALWQLILFGVICIPAGFFAWHRMGPIRFWFAHVPVNIGKIKQDSNPASCEEPQESKAELIERRDVGILCRDFSGRLTYEIHQFPSKSYKAIKKELAKKFGLWRVGATIVGFDEAFQEFRKGLHTYIGIEWDIWCGLIIVAHNTRAEPLILEIAEYLEKAALPYLEAEARTPDGIG